MQEASKVSNQRNTPPCRVCVFLRVNQYVNMLSSTIQGETQKSSKGRLLKQKIEFFQADSYIVDYTYENKEYKLLVDILSENVYAPESPFSQMAEEAILRVKRKVSQKEYGEAMRIVKQAAILGKGSNREMEIESLMDNVNSLIFDAYKKGVILGLVANWLIHILIIFISDNTKDSVDYWKFLYPSIICILLFFLGWFFESKIRKFANNIISKYIIDNAIVRMLIGAGFVTAIVFVLMLFAK